jgi:hypothetical protein
VVGRRRGGPRERDRRPCRKAVENVACL